MEAARRISRYSTNVSCFPLLSMPLWVPVFSWTPPWGIDAPNICSIVPSLLLPSPHLNPQLRPGQTPSDLRFTIFRIFYLQTFIPCPWFSGTGVLDLPGRQDVPATFPIPSGYLLVIDLLSVYVALGQMISGYGCLYWSRKGMRNILVPRWTSLDLKH